MAADAALGHAALLRMTTSGASAAHVRTALASLAASDAAAGCTAVAERSRTRGMGWPLWPPSEWAGVAASATPPNKAQCCLWQALEHCSMEVFEEVGTTLVASATDAAVGSVPQPCWGCMPRNPPALAPK
jgi:hypothetical protein